MSESSSIESSPIMNAPELNVEDEPEVHFLTQVEVNEQIRSHIAPLTKQLEDLTARHPTSFRRAGTSTRKIPTLSF